jgi:neurofibromin 1
VSIKSTTHIAATNAAYEKTHMSLVKSSLSVNNLIAKYVGRIIFHISASNWNMVFERLSTKIAYLATHPDGNPDAVDLQLMSHSVLDRLRLVLLLNRAFFSPPRKSKHRAKLFLCL